MSSEDNVVSIAPAREGRARGLGGAGARERSTTTAARAGRNVILLASAGAGARVAVLPVGRMKIRRRPQAAPEATVTSTPPDAA